VIASLQTQIALNFGDIVKRLERPELRTWELISRSLKFYWEYSKQGLENAERLLRKAVASTPTSCDAHQLLASVLSYQVMMEYVIGSDEIDATICEAYELAKRAVSLDDNNEYAHKSLGLIQHVKSNNDIAISDFERALELNPNCSLASGKKSKGLSYSNSVLNLLHITRSHSKVYSISVLFLFSNLLIIKGTDNAN
jgi:tetratricopeptide (TPR) repeat protein